MKRQLIAGAAVLALALVPTTMAGATTQQYAHPKIEKWLAHQGGKQALKALVKDLSAIGNDSSGGNLDAVGGDCQNLRNDAQIDLNIKPIPSVSIERLWVAALNDYEQGGMTCVNGVNDVSASEIQEATSDFAAGNAVLNHLNSEL